MLSTHCCYQGCITIVHWTIDRDPRQLPKACRVKGEPKLKDPGVWMFSSHTSGLDDCLSTWCFAMVPNISKSRSRKVLNLLIPETRGHDSTWSVLVVMEMKRVTDEADTECTTTIGSICTAVGLLWVFLCVLSIQVCDCACILCHKENRLSQPCSRNPSPLPTLQPPNNTESWWLFDSRAGRQMPQVVLKHSWSLMTLSST